jgi:hypothetical protein
MLKTISKPVSFLALVGKGMEQQLGNNDMVGTAAR